MFEETPWIWNKGIAALCDHRFPEEFPRGKYSSHETSLKRSQSDNYSTLASKISSSDLVWVKIDYLPYFVSHVLTEIKHDFILVTGDSDVSMPSSMPYEAKKISESPKISHWYTQNYDGTSTTKMSPLPIGMDFHSIQQQDYWGVSQMSVTSQCEALEMIRARLRPTKMRKQKLYIDSQFSHRIDQMRQGAANGLSRSDVHRLIHTDPAVHLQPHFLPQFEMWEQRGEYTYVLSHHGNGLDCHRNWEALVLGHVLVVQESSMDSLYEGLPVIIVDDWQTVKPSSVGELLCMDIKPNFEKLTNRYWVDKMRFRAKQI